MADADVTARNGGSGSGSDRRRGPVTLAELTAGLVWPLLLRAPALALYPPRVFIGLLTIAAVALVAWVFDGALGWFDVSPVGRPLLVEMSASLSAFARETMAGDFAEAAGSLGYGLLGAPVSVAAERPVAFAALLLLLAPVWMIGGGAICRMVAVDVAGRTNLSTADGLISAARNASSLTWALLIPVVAMAAAALALKAAGWALFSLPVIDVIGGLVYGLMILAAVFLTLLALGFALGQALLAPAVMVEGADALDAVQRAYAYIFGRPGRAALYLVGALAQGVVVCVIAHWVVATSLAGAAGLSLSWISDERREALRGAAEAEGPPTAGWLMLEWENLAWALLAGFVVSLYFAASTLVYMLLRRVNDEQDVQEVWG